jgi:hypothetical protein
MKLHLPKMLAALDPIIQENDQFLELSSPNISFGIQDACIS